MIGWAIAIAASVVFLAGWYVGGADFSRAHARRRTYVLSAIRLVSYRHTPCGT
jgi:hypothetical protein